MSHEQIQTAAENNARWCDAVCRAHGCTCEFTAGAWLTRDTPPPYHSNLVTFRAGQIVSQQQQELIREIVTSDPARAFGFKDSFCSIDPVEAGGGRAFDLLFEATWIWSEAARAGPGRHALRWERIDSEPQLLNWEHAWRGDAANQSAAAVVRQFPTSLLTNPDFAFLAGRNANEKISAVAAANRSGDVIGLSNLFFHPTAADPTDVWLGATSAAREAFPLALPLVGYQRGDALRHATNSGFQPIGPLRVYVLTTHALPKLLD